jgi:membrane protein
MAQSITAGQMVPAKGEKRGVLGIAKAALRDFMADECGVRAAALCYYTVFALPPLLMLLLIVAGAVWGADAVSAALEKQFAGLLGAEGGRAVRDMVASGQTANKGTASALGAAGLLFGATGAFFALQQALNHVWEVKPDPARGGIKRFITKRLLSLGMVMVLAFLLVVSLAVTAAISALSGRIGASGVVLQVVSLAVSLAVLSVTFAALFKFLPDAEVSWHDVLVGGLVTAVLFELGKLGIGLYLGKSDPGSAFGTASALAVILVWIYYAGMLVLLGAEVTQQYAEARGAGIRPKEGAVRVVKEELTLRGAEAAGVPKGSAAGSDAPDRAPTHPGGVGRRILDLAMVALAARIVRRGR